MVKKLNRFIFVEYYWIWLNVIEYNEKLYLKLKIIRLNISNKFIIISLTFIIITNTSHLELQAKGTNIRLSLTKEYFT